MSERARRHDGYGSSEGSLTLHEDETLEPERRWLDGQPDESRITRRREEADMFTASDREYIAKVRENQSTPAQEATNTFLFGMSVTLIYTGIAYALQHSVNKMLEDYS